MVAYMHEGALKLQNTPQITTMQLPCAYLSHSVPAPGKVRQGTRVEDILGRVQ